jgi:UDP-glucose/GDP-mannose dehydrogenase family, NAD binding domain
MGRQLRYTSNAPFRSIACDFGPAPPAGPSGHDLLGQPGVVCPSPFKPVGWGYPPFRRGTSSRYVLANRRVLAGRPAPTCDQCPCLDRGRHGPLDVMGTDFGHRVICVDRDAEKVAALARGEMPIYEPGLHDLVRSNVRAGRLSFSTTLPQARSR